MNSLRSLCSPFDTLPERDVFETRLKVLFGDKIRSVHRSESVIADFKDGSFALSQMGLMLYGNGFNLRGRSLENPVGLLYYDGANMFGIGYFAKEGSSTKHLHIICPKGPTSVIAVRSFVSKVRASQLTVSSIYIRQLNHMQREAFLAAGFQSIVEDPWHPVCLEEDEHYPNRVFDLNELLVVKDGTFSVKNLDGPDHAAHRDKNRLALNRFQNFLLRNQLTFTLRPYSYTAREQSEAESIVRTYFDERNRQGTLVGSTPEDYFALIRQKPHGANEEDYFSYLGCIVDSAGRSVPIAFFAGEKVSTAKVAMYATISMRFPQLLKFPQILETQGFSAVSQFTWLNVFARLLSKGVHEVDAGGSETLGLDDQKRQLGGRAEKSHWVVLRSGNIDLGSTHCAHEGIRS